MNNRMRHFAALLAALGLLTIGAGPAGAQPISGQHELRVAGHRPSRIGIAPAACQDSAYKLLGASWSSTYEWVFQAASTPASLSRSSVKAVLRRSFDNLTGARNDCGRADLIGASHSFVGQTGRRPNCSKPDGHNVIGFDRLQYGVLAVTCYWMRNGRMIEADIKINSREMWALSLDRCRDRPVLEATMTHEAGHVFGLDHIGERRHGRLTMSPYLDGPCENAESTLGLGDMRGLEMLY